MAMPDLTPVQSGNIAAIGHDGADLYIRFHDGGIYRYPGVPADLHQSMLTADSINSHFRHNVRGKFPGVKVDAENA